MDSISVLLAASALWLLYLLSLAVYRIWLSPVANVPGPLLARLTYWYEFYWDVIHVGRYVFHIKDLHDQYGPIIRINPHEIHINDPTFYDELYISGTSGRKRNKWPWFYGAFGVPDGTFATIDHDLHRIRRAALNPFFSKGKVRALQQNLEYVFGKFVQRMDGFRGTDDAFPLGLGFSAIANDIASSYAFDVQSLRVDAADFAPDFHRAAEKAAKQAHLIKQFPFILSLSQSLPDSVVTAMDPDLGAYIGLQRYLQRTTKEIQAAYHSPDYKAPDEPKIFHQILTSPHLPESQKHHARLWQEAQLVVIAGTITTATTFTTIFYFLLENPTILQKLRDELANAIHDPNKVPNLATLESLPYLTACIIEALRWSNGVSARLQRIDPEKNLVFKARKDNKLAPAVEDKTYILPPGTPISMTTMLIHYNEEIYPEPMSFDPERWLDNGVLHRRLDKYFAPFSKGTRNCLGMELAWAELYLLLAMVFRPGKYGSKEVQREGDIGYLELFDSSFERDIEIVGDGTTPIVREQMKGIKVKIRACDGKEM